MIRGGQITRNGAKCLLAVAGLALATQAQAQTARTLVGFICPNLNATAGRLEVRVSNVCLPAGSQIEAQDLSLEVDQQHALIKVTGGFEASPGSRVGNTYCPATQYISLDADGIEARRYTVLYEGEYLGVANFLRGEDPPECLDASNLLARRSGPSILRLSFADWDANPVAGWRDWRGTDPWTLLSPILSTHPESLEGGPRASVEMERLRWRGVSGMNRGGPPWFIGVWITRHGFADDSVSGDRYFAGIVPDEAGWRVERLWRQHMCARGDQAGQWTTTGCP